MRPVADGNRRIRHNAAAHPLSPPRRLHHAAPRQRFPDDPDDSDHMATDDPMSPRSPASEREEGELAEPKRISRREYARLRNTAPEGDQRDDAKPADPPASNPALDQLKREHEQRAARAQPKAHHVDIRDEFFAREYQDSPPRLRKEPTEPVYFRHSERYDFGVGQPVTADEAISWRQMRRSTFKMWRETRRPIVGVPIIGGTEQECREFDRLFWHWVAETKNVDLAQMRNPQTVGQVEKHRDMRIRFAKLFVDNRLEEEYRVAALARPPAQDPSPPEQAVPTMGRPLTGTTPDGPARTRERDHGSHAGGRLHPPTSFGYGDTQATSPRTGGPYSSYARPRSPRHDSGVHHSYPGLAAAPGPVGPASVWPHVGYPSRSPDQLYQLQQRMSDLELRVRDSMFWVRQNYDRLQQVVPSVEDAWKESTELHRRVDQLSHENQVLRDRVSDLGRRFSYEYSTRPRRSRSRSRGRSPPLKSHDESPAPSWTSSGRHGSYSRSYQRSPTARSPRHRDEWDPGDDTVSKPT